MSSWSSPPQTPEFAAKLRAAEAHLCAASPPLAAVIRRAGPCLLAPDPDTFAVLIRSVISQLISVAAAKAITTRLYAACGDKLTPRRVAALSDETLKAVGISGGKSRTVRGVCAAFTGDRQFAKKLAAADDPTARAMLLPLYGVGAWTVDMLLMFSLGHLDVFPAGDLVVRSGLKVVLGLAETPTQPEAARLGAAWTPARTVAAYYLWRSKGWVPEGAKPLESIAETPAG